MMSRTGAGVAASIVKFDKRLDSDTGFVGVVEMQGNVVDLEILSK